MITKEQTQDLKNWLTVNAIRIKNKQPHSMITEQLRAEFMTFLSRHKDEFKMLYVEKEILFDNWLENESGFSNWGKE